jgi:hypothetical protein
MDIASLEEKTNHTNKIRAPQICINGIFIILQYLVFEIVYPYQFYVPAPD